MQQKFKRYCVECSNWAQLMSLPVFGTPGYPYTAEWSINNIQRNVAYPVYVDMDFIPGEGLLLYDYSVLPSDPMVDYIEYNEFLDKLVG